MLLILALVAAADLVALARRRGELQRELVAQRVDRALRAAGES